MTPINPTFIQNLIKGDSKLNGAPFTAKSTRTEKDFTFKIKRTQFMGKWYSHVYVETQYLRFLYLGYYKDGRIVKKGQLISSDAANAISWILRQSERSLDLSVVEFFHFGRCLKCGRALTDAHSIETGFGPICRGQLN